MITGIEHIGIAVKNLARSNDLFSQILGKEPYKEEEVESESVVTSFFHVGNTKLELLNSLSEDGPISKFIGKKGEGIHHIAFSVDDIHSEIERMVGLGLIPLMNEPKKGADNKLIFFFHPKSANGILIELCQDIEEQGE